MKKSRKIKKRSKQIIIALFFMGIGIITIAIMLIVLVNRTEAPAPTYRLDDRTDGASDDGLVTLLATGDWIAHDAINAEAKSIDGYDYSSMTTDFKDIFAGSDINFCNLSTMAGGEQFGVSGYPSFNAPLEWNRDMAKLGCNVINTGTNHTNDKGQAVIDANLDYLDSIDSLLAVAGAGRNPEEQRQVRYFEKKGIKFAFLSYSTYSNSPNPNPYSLSRFEDDLVTAQMAEASQNADIVIVSMRWGSEYSDAINTTQQSMAQKLSSLGASIVLGHGTHTLQAVDKLVRSNGDETIVWYGLGNFLNAQLDVGGLTGCVAKIKISVDTKSVGSNECLPFYQHYEWSASDEAAERLMARSGFKVMPLNKADEYIAKSQLNTNVDEQRARIQSAINQLTEVSLVSH